MKVYVKTLGGKKYSAEIHQSASVRSLKKQIQNKVEVHPDEQRLMYRNYSLEDTRSLSEYDIRPNATLQLALWPVEGLPDPLLGLPTPQEYL